MKRQDRTQIRVNLRQKEPASGEKKKFTYFVGDLASLSLQEYYGRESEKQRQRASTYDTGVTTKTTPVLPRNTTRHSRCRDTPRGPWGVNEGRRLVEKKGNPRVKGSVGGAHLQIASGRGKKITWEGGMRWIGESRTGGARGKF